MFPFDFWDILKKTYKCLPLRSKIFAGVSFHKFLHLYSNQGKQLSYYKELVIYFLENSWNFK